MSEVDNFFGGLEGQDKQEQDIFDEKPQVPAEKVEEKPEAPHKNRRHRRLEEALEKERESNIALNERVKVLSEQQKFIKETTVGEVDERFLRIYGDSPESRTAWKLQQDLIAEYAKRAKEEAIQEIEQRALNAQREQKQYESFIDSELENIEDEYNVDITSDSPSARKTRREFLEMVEKFSPKDEDGTIKDYADFSATWEAYQSSKKGTNETLNKQKEIASRSMKTGSTAPSPDKQPTPGFRGWMTDLNL